MNRGRSSAHFLDDIERLAREGLERRFYLLRNCHLDTSNIAQGIGFLFYASQIFVVFWFRLIVLRLV
jgi:hypothetical protein